MQIAVLQSNFLPWIGYFHLIQLVDQFLLYDCVQYTKNDWRNRNQILSKNGVHWLTLQVERPYSWCNIDEVTVVKKSFSKAILTLKNSYRQARTFSTLDEIILTPMYEILECEKIKLSMVNEKLIRNISNHFNIHTKISKCSTMEYRDLIEEPDKTKRLIKILSRFGATSYLSGPSALNYLDGSHPPQIRNPRSRFIQMTAPENLPHLGTESNTWEHTL